MFWLSLYDEKMGAIALSYPSFFIYGSGAESHAD